MKLNKTLLILSIGLIGINFSACKDDEETPCDKQSWYQDMDGDGYGNSDIITNDCDQPEGYVANDSDLDDTDADVNIPDIWTGDKITFTKATNVDINLEANQDRLTPNVWLTRDTKKGIFNIKIEPSYVDFESPIGTLWAFGTTANLKDLTFQAWEEEIMSEPVSVMLNKDMVLYLVQEKQYVDIKFTSWSQGDGNGTGSGGGFEYIRSTP